MTLEEQYNYLIDYEIVSQETLNIITSINGYNENTINDILYATTGYRDMEQYLEYGDEETYNEYYNEYYNEDEDEDEDEDEESDEEW